MTQGSYLEMDEVGGKWVMTCKGDNLYEFQLEKLNVVFSLDSHGCSNNLFFVCMTFLWFC